MVKVGDFVKIRATGEKGKFMAVYPASDGSTLLIKTPTGDRHIDLPPGPYNPADHLEFLPTKPA